MTRKLKNTKTTLNSSVARVFLIRHGQVDKTNQCYDELNKEGKDFRDRLPQLIRNTGIFPVTKFFDIADDNNRCRETLSRIKCPGFGFAPHNSLRNLNAVLKSLSIAGDYLVCYRSETIESGDLYHVLDLELHTSFLNIDYTDRVHTIMAKGYDFIYQIESSPVGIGVWCQTGRIKI